MPPSATESRDNGNFGPKEALLLSGLSFTRTWRALRIGGAGAAPPLRAPIGYRSVGNFRRPEWCVFRASAEQRNVGKKRRSRRGTARGSLASLRARRVGCDVGKLRAFAVTAPHAPVRALARAEPALPQKNLAATTSRESLEEKHALEGDGSKRNRQQGQVSRLSRTEL